MDNTPPLPDKLLLETEFDLISTTTLSGVFYGIALSLYYLYVQSSLSQLQDSDRKKQTKFMLAYTSVIMLSGLVFLGGNTWVIQAAYIHHRNFAGGPYTYEREVLGVQLSALMFDVPEIIIHVLSSAIQVWHLWKVWKATKYANIIVILPLLVLFASAASWISAIILTLKTRVTSTGISHNIPIAALALQIAVTIPVTVLIIVYLIFTLKHHARLTGTSYLSKQYMNIVAILVESYALESTWMFMALVLALVGHPLGSLFSNCQPYIEIIAYLLVVYRVSIGQAWGSKTGYRLSNLHWNHAAQSGAASGTGTQRFQAQVAQTSVPDSLPPALHSPVE